MRAVLVFVLLFATVLCRPARKFSVSSSESSEEVRRPVRLIRKQTVLVPQTRAAPVQNIAVAAAAGSDESSDEDKQVIAEAPMELKADSPDTTSASDTDSVTSQDSADDDDDDDDTEESETEEEEEEEESSNSSESGESSTPSPATITPMVVTDEPVIDATEEPVNPTIVVDPGRGDNLGGYPSDYKSIIYVEDKSYHKMPSPYKSYEFVDAGKKTAYDMTDGNEVEKTLKVYKVQALQVHADILEEDTSTPDVESQGLDTSFGTSQDQDLSPRQASVPEEEDSATTSESASASQEAEDEDSESEEATATPGAQRQPGSRR
ncbi:hypothetical protein LDENG_00273850 [Lucifuga dentata]|nr:hypothetical protein LDENG_00273850 [Lucifuga dentata]